jgi:rubrerythrin
MGKEPHRVRVGRAISEDEEAVGYMGIQVEESALPSTREVDDTGFVDFAVAGTEVAGEFRCAECGYGAVVQRALPQCPMCAGTVWESRGPTARRFTD